ncbi:MAG: flagellar hook basal-body protein [Candidatus Eremiobacteraeota bacterium]|nr:flagellar hook basal-body protein [Candidatus Eremiobacteraeota bacterium]
MDRALFASASGMAAQQQNLDTIAANLANADVAGFKGSVEAFAELAAPGESGLGTVSLGSHVLFTQGKLARSGGAFDLAIDGPGFFAVTDPQGRLGYTRGGAFSRAADGSLCDGEGNRLRGLEIPADALSLSVTADGTIRATFPGGTRAIGTLRITEFAAPDRLRSVGGTFFETTSESGRPKTVLPGSKSGPQIRFGMLEQSNVSIVDAMMQILAAQRAYEANAKGVQAADEMLRIANNLQRG